MRFRHFTGSGPDLDHEISEWIMEGAEIHFMSHSQAADGSITVCFVFQESFAAQEKRLIEEHAAHDSGSATARPDPVHVESEGVG